MDCALTGSFIAKQLASCDKKTRDRALQTLKTWLPSQHQVPEEEMKKIWKGLFYCVWHADKQPVQLELINRLTSLLVSLDLVVSFQYIEVFLTTMGREWSGIDFLRLDKFYLLFRRFIHNLFFLLKKNSWDIELLSRFMGVLEEKTLLANDKYPAQGVNYHISEIFLDELKPFLPIRREALDALLSPFFSVMMKSADKVQLNKIKSSMFGCLLRNGRKLLDLRKSGDDVDSSDEVVLFGTIALNLGLSSKFFDMGSSSDCLQGNRKVLFALHKEFLKLAKDLENAGIEIPYPQVEDGNADEVPDLIPIIGQDVQAAEVSSEPVEVAAVVANGSADKPSKKNKKAKKALVGNGKKAKKVKKNKNVVPDSMVLENGTTSDDQNEVVNVNNGENSNGNLTHDGNLIAFSESVISNLQMQFEKVAAEVGMGVDGMSSLDSPTSVINRSVSKKRKRSKSTDGQVSHTLGLCNPGVVGGSAAGKSGENSAKKVRFSMKNNLVWKPHSPLPPQSLRLPPSATPRGSALKKGIPAGPIREIPPTTKRVKLKTSSVKKGRKAKKSVLPAIKQLRKLRSLSV
ncbi:ribosomal RNA processing protein 1 homolog isoform X2 [Telopea speciosissima]|uniref:ribosomal RNA processing protein 1 homolog isoform X2 n=1 Tax=Telopea speciosissima TaxID=54955 RepID=UPI001CC6F884|nr:ribosomal RNA processing protein 1 homolog isoform X2 [Telopea speciosissima]